MRREVDGHADVADAGRERARRAGWRSRRASPSQPLREQPAELEHGRVEPLDVADLERHARVAGAAATISSALVDGAPRAASRRAPARPRSMAASASGAWAVVGAAMTTRVELRLVDHRQRVGEPRGAGLRDGVGERRRRPDRRPRRASQPCARREMAEVVAAHRAEPGEADPQRRGHRRTAPERRRSAVARRRDLADRRDDRLELVVGQARADGDRQDLVGEPVRDRQVEVGRARDERLEVRLAVDGHRVVDERPDRRARRARR